MRNDAAGKVIAITGMRYQPPEAVVGSIMDLDPSVEYEVRLELRDPDGGKCVGD
jgi:hypothetical protein